MDVCQFCEKRPKTCVWFGKFCCDDCRPDDFGVPYFKMTVTLPDYGSASVARLKEMDRRVLTPIEKKDSPGHNHVGRVSDNGRIQEKTGDLTP